MTSVRDRRVLVALALLVAAVLGANVLSAAVPGMDETLATWPVVVVLLVSVTIIVLVATLRGRPRG